MSTLLPQTPPPTGRTIVRELVKEMEEQLYPLMYRTLPPSVFHVYLHPEDYRAIASVSALIVSDATRGLTARVGELNQRSRLFSFVAGQRAPIDIPAGGWEVHLQPELNGDVDRGDFRIESRLAVPPAPTYDGGVATVRIGRTTVSGESRKTKVVEEPVLDDTGPMPRRETPAGTASTAPPAHAGVLTVPPAAVEPTTAIEPTAAIDAAATTRPGMHHADEPGSGFARLAYVDEQGPHLFVIRKELVAIGRGGSARWVDVQIASTPRVSRVHCRIRRDPAGRFFLQDVSTWGTFLDGDRVPPYLRRTGDTVDETGEERELPPGARIQLADAVTIEFQVLSR